MGFIILFLTMFSLEAKLRNENAKATRVKKRTPAVVYGKDITSTSISVDVSEFLKLFRQAWQNHVVTLTLEWKEHPVLIHEVVRHPVTHDFLHVDFLVIDMKADTYVDIPVVLTGTSPAVLEWCQIQQYLFNVEVKCKPKDIIDSLEIDISALTHAGQVLHVSDIIVDAKKHTITNNPEEPVVAVHEIKEQVEEEVAPETPIAEAEETQTEKEWEE